MTTNVRRQLEFSDLSYRTTEQALRNYFSLFGTLENLVLYKDDQAQSLREGYLTYTNSNSIDDIMSKRPHFVDNRQICLRRRMPVNQFTSNRCISESLGINLTVNEIFISRLCSGETQKMFVRYFQRFGVVTNCRVFNSRSQYRKQMGYAFLRFNDYDSVDQIILSKPHVIHSKFYHIRKCIPREYNYIVSSIKPISSNQTHWRDYALGLINMQTGTVIYPSSSRCTIQSAPTIPSNQPKSAAEITTRRNSSTDDFEIVTTSSLSSSISIINSTDEDFTPLPSPLYATAIAYSPTTDII